MRWYESKDPTQLFKACQRMGVGKETLTLVLCKVIRECDPDYESLIGLNILEDHIIRQDRYEGPMFDPALLHFYRGYGLEYATSVFKRLDDMGPVVAVINKHLCLAKLDDVFKIHCINKCIAMWQALADDPSLSKTDALDQTGGGRPVSLCWLCEYVTAVGVVYPPNCSLCPVKWSRGLCTESEYDAWVRADDPDEQAMFASRIVDICKEALL